MCVSLSLSHACYISVPCIQFIQQSNSGILLHTSQGFHSSPCPMLVETADWASAVLEPVSEQHGASTGCGSHSQGTPWVCHIDCQQHGKQQQGADLHSEVGDLIKSPDNQTLESERLANVCCTRIQCSLRFKTPPFNNSFHFKATYQWHNSYIFNTNISFHFKATSNIRPYFLKMQGPLYMYTETLIYGDPLEILKQL